MGEKWPVKFSQTIRLPRNSWVLLHAANLRRGTDGFTSPPKECTLRIFFRPKNPMASAGFEPANMGTRSQGGEVQGICSSQGSKAMPFGCAGKGVTEG
jgi:hypothetical protein